MTGKQHVLQIKDRRFFEAFLRLEEHRLCTYAFTNIYIWKGLFGIFWTVIDGSLCVFFKDALGCFMYLPPLGPDKNPRVIEKAFAIMAKHNRCAGMSRIENVEEKDIPVYKQWGYRAVFKSREYLCKRTDMAALRGDRFSSKRACVNYFMKTYSYECMPFKPEYAPACLSLYNRWMEKRARKNKDAVYTGMMRDSLKSLTVLLNDYRRLDCQGMVVFVDKAIKAFTFGFPLCKDTFCVLYEITDLSVKGLSQFVFKSFCGKLEGYAYVNIMDDSGLENLEKVKLSYRPASLVPAYNIMRPE